MFKLWDTMFYHPTDDNSFQGGGGGGNNNCVLFTMRMILRWLEFINSNVCLLTNVKFEHCIVDCIEYIKFASWDAYFLNEGVKILFESMLNQTGGLFCAGSILLPHLISTWRLTVRADITVHHEIKHLIH